MATILRAIVQLYHKLNYEYSDPRTHNYFMMSSPWPVFGLLLFYNYFVTKLGPEIMKHRKPFNVDKIIQFYNLFQILICSYLVVQASLKAYVFGDYNLFCEPVDFSDTAEATLIARHVWLYFMVKVSDLMDTVFFVLRKKNSQITFLHVYHHMGMVILGWAGTKYFSGGSAVFMGYINSMVHIVMYAYYLITNYYPEHKNKIWWKKYITQMQILQFLLNIIQYTAILLMPDCGFPKWMGIILIPQNMFMLFLFADFYKKSYINKPKIKN